MKVSTSSLEDVSTGLRVNKHVSTNNLIIMKLLCTMKSAGCERIRRRDNIFKRNTRDTAATGICISISSARARKHGDSVLRKYSQQQVPKNKDALRICK